MAAVALALGAAALWGTGDFLGGLTTRRLNVLIVLFWSQLVGLLGLAVWIVLSGDERPGARLLWAAGAGIAGAVGLGCLYRGMAVGAMGIVAPISCSRRLSCTTLGEHSSSSAAPPSARPRRAGCSVTSTLA